MNLWDKVSDCFDTHKSEGEISPDAADNILIAWPAIFEGIEKVQRSGKGLTAFDFGCGAGSFAQALHDRGYQVEASDTSSAMIMLAKSHLGKIIDFHIAGVQEATSLKGAPFALITSVMVLQFIQDIESTLNSLDNALSPGGLIAFAVHNPDYILRNKNKGAYTQVSRGANKIDTFMLTNGVRIPLYLRTEQEYNALLKERSYTRVLCKRPRFTRAFLNKYPKSTDTRFSEYIVMVYKKKARK